MSYSAQEERKWAGGGATSEGKGKGAKGKGKGGRLYLRVWAKKKRTHEIQKRREMK